MYEYYNANALGRMAEDCTVRSISSALGISWDKAYQLLSNEARLQAQMMDNAGFIVRFLDSHFERVPLLGKTVGETSKMYDGNVLLITMKNHITCSRYGKIVDTFDCRNRLVQEAWIVN